MKIDKEKTITELKRWVSFNTEIPEHLRIAQGFDELRDFFDVLDTLPQRESCLEIGVFNGGTIYLWKMFFDNVTGIDIDNNCCNYVSSQLQKYGCDMGSFNIICGDSQLQKTISQLGDKKFDMIFIDGAHGYEALKLDFENYLPFLKVGGIVAIHDVGQEDKPHGYTPPGLTPTFELLHDCAIYIMNNNEKYGVSKMKFIHIDHGGIGWCAKLKEVN